MNPVIASEFHAYPLLIGKLLVNTRLTHADSEIVSAGLARYTYGDFLERVERLAAGLARLGIRRGDTVAVMNWDCHRYLECFFAVPMMGAVLHTINIRYSPEQILYTINHAEDDAILVHEDFVPLLDEISAGIVRPTRRVLIQDGPSPPEALPDGYDIEYESILKSGDEGYAFEDFDESTIATTFYTSGTTGSPKGVFYSHRQLVLHTLGALSALSSIEHEVRLHRGDVYMPMTPLFHAHGWGMPYVATLLGLKQVYARRYDPSRLIACIVGEGATFSHCVPTILHMMLSAPEAASADLSSLKVLIGGSAMPYGLAHMAVEMGVQVFTAYGLSETCPFLTFADIRRPGPAGAGEPEIRSRLKTGKPVPLAEVRVVDEHMNDLPAGERHTGEVVVRAPWLTPGYTDNRDGSEALWQGGYLHTGDIGYLDESGSLQITDRLKDVIKSGGEWISSIALESIISRHEGIDEVAVIGIPDPRWGERPMAIAVRNDPSVDEQCIRSRVAAEVDLGKLPKWAIPDRVVFVESIDKTSVGKLDKKRLRTRYSADSE
ncbi:MAG: long-chain fatty acid--CoA ligase [Gammaproteobacteria bacterium]|nr:long-chain fatty acid--CoA ligase [Gammaproteobacteria bacterium]